MKAQNILRKFSISFLLLIILNSIINCSSNKISNNNVISPENVIIISSKDSLPPDLKFIENLKIGYFPPYLAQYKNYDSLIIEAKRKTAEMGGNVLQIISHSPYQLKFEKKDLILHKINAKIYYSENQLNIKAEKKNKIVNNESLLNFFMLDQGPLVKKDIYLNDSIIIKNFKSKSKIKYVIKTPGTYVLKFGKNGIPLKIYIEKNKVYYLQCYMKIGGMWNKSVIEEVKDTKEFDYL